MAPGGSKSQQREPDASYLQAFARRLERRVPVRGRERCPGCHPSLRSGSLRPSSQTLRGVYPERSAWAQGDRHVHALWELFVSCSVSIYTRRSYLDLDFVREQVVIWNYVYTWTVCKARGSLGQDYSEMGPPGNLARETDDYQPTILYR